ncbi:MAG: hypothetical protein AB7F64_01220 [Gammaproteobacteria bacterium]
MNTYETHGGTLGHWARRMFHLSMFFIPFFYYWGNIYFPTLIDPVKNQTVSAIVLIILLFEFIRYRNGWTLFGQRSYEAKQISALAQTTLAVGIVLLISPKIGLYQAAIGTPLICALALTDPLMGELRKLHFSYYWILNLGLLCITIVWILSVIVLHTPWILLPFVIPLTILGEVIKTPIVDDNLLMLFFPLLAVILIMPWI